MTERWGELNRFLRCDAERASGVYNAVSYVLELSGELQYLRSLPPDLREQQIPVVGYHFACRIRRRYREIMVLEMG